MSRNILSLLVLCTITFGGQVGPNSNVAQVAPQKQALAPTLETDQITIPGIISYQGKLLDNSGNPVPDSNYSITFRLYTVPSGGTPYWTEARTIMTQSGLFTCLLGEATPIPYIPANGNCYLEMQVNPAGPLSPRIRLVTSPYTFLARKADSALYATSATPSGTAGGDLTGTYPNPTIANNAVNSAKIQDGQVTSADLANNTVTSAKIADTNVTMPQLPRAVATTGQVIKWNGTHWAPAADEVGTPDNAWVRGTPDSVL